MAKQEDINKAFAYNGMEAPKTLIEPIDEKPPASRRHLSFLKGIFYLFIILMCGSAYYYFSNSDINLFDNEKSNNNDALKFNCKSKNSCTAKEDAEFLLEYKKFDNCDESSYSERDVKECLIEFHNALRLRHNLNKLEYGKGEEKTATIKTQYYIPKLNDIISELNAKYNTQGVKLGDAIFTDESANSNMRVITDQFCVDLPDQQYVGDYTDATVLSVSYCVMLKWIQTETSYDKILNPQWTRIGLSVETAQAKDIKVVAVDFG